MFCFVGNIILRVIIDSNDGMDFLRYTLSVGNAPMTTNGLLGTFNGDPSDDFLTRDGTTMSPDSSEEDIYNLFCVPCKYLCQRMICAAGGIV